MVKRIRGDLGDRMISAAAEQILGNMWTGHAGQIGLNQPRSDWYYGIRRGLEAAFDELLKEPRAATDEGAR